MTPPERADDRTERDQFETELGEIVARARDDDVQLDGAYNVRSPHRDVPDYTIEISEIAKRRPGWTGGLFRN